MNYMILVRRKQQGHKYIKKEQNEENSRRQQVTPHIFDIYMEEYDVAKICSH